MDLLEPTRQAFALLLRGDPELLQIIWLSLWLSVAAIALIAPPSIALGVLLAKRRFPGQRAMVVLVQALLSFPTVVIGLVIYLLLSRRGPLGSFELLFTPTRDRDRLHGHRASDPGGVHGLGGAGRRPARVRNRAQPGRERARARR